MKRIFALIVAIFLLLLCGCTQSRTPLSVSQVKKPKIDWKISDSDVKIENATFAIGFSASTGEVTITNKSTGAVYSSRQGKSAEENSALSELILTYYDTQSTIHTMNSYSNSIKLGSFKTYSAENAIRIEYEFNEKNAELLVPAVMTVERYEAIKKALPSKDVQKLSMYYELIYSSDDTSRVQALKEKYPYLKKNDLYVVFDSLMTNEKQKLSDIIKSAGYTAEEYMKDIKVMGISQSEINVPVSFKLPVEYYLTDNGFNVEVCSNELEYAKSLATLQSIKLFPGFGLAGERAESFILADGSGSVSLLEENSDEFITVPIYGGDLTVSSKNESILSQSYRLPVCGYNATGGSWYAVVNSAAEAGYINAEVMGNTNKADALYYSFDIEAMDKLSIRPGSNISDVNYYSGKKLSVNPSVNYYLCDEELTANSLAQKYRNVIKSNLNLKGKKSDGDLVWLEFTGYEMVNTTIMGVPTQKKVVLSKLSEIQKAVDKLHKNGVKDINLRLKGFGNYGANHAAANTFQLDKSVGSIKELEKLAKTLSSNGGRLYLENDVSFAYKDYSFDGFNPRNDAVYSLSGSLCYKSDFDLVELDFKKKIDTKYIISPYNYLSYMKGFTEKYTKKVSNDDIGISWIAGGQWIFSDFNDKFVLDRTDSLYCTNSTFKYMKENYSSVMTDGGNLYAVPFADCITNIPLYSSEYSIKSFEEPLYHYLLHGIVDYTGESISTSLYRDKLKTRSVSLGAGFLYSCVTEEDAYRELDSYKKSGLFAPDINTLTEQIVDDYKLYGSFYKNKAGSTITSVSELGEGIVKTEYSNGAFSIVNNTDKTVNVSGFEIAANSAYVSEVA